MTVIQNSTVIAQPIGQVYAFLADLNNHEQLMPDNIDDWSSTVDEARFTIKNMIKLALKVTQRVENREIVCLPSEEIPFAMKLSWKLEELSEQETKATFAIEAEFNMMMRMMASGPLQKLVDYQVVRLKEVLNG